MKQGGTEVILIYSPLFLLIVLYLFN